MSTGPAGDLFGLSRALSDAEAQDLGAFLSAAWLAQSGRPPGGLAADLDQLEKYFTPTSTGRRLRTVISGLAPSGRKRPSWMPTEMFLSSPNGRGLVTPEGRIVLHLLEQHWGDDPVAFDIYEVGWAYRTVADLYRVWSRGRLLEAMGITERALRLPVVAFNLFMLINGSVGEENAFPIPVDEDREEELSRIVGPVIDAFVVSLNPERKLGERFRLRSGWVVTETSRHLFGYIGYEKDAIWIVAGRVEMLIGRLSRELARARARTPVDVDVAFGRMVEAYANARPTLASRRVAHERSVATRTVRERLLAGFAEARLPGWSR